MAMVGQSTLILTTSRTSVQQWRRELLDKTTLQPEQIVEYQSDAKQIGPVTLQTVNAEVAEAICKCSLLRPHLLARIGPRAVLVKPESARQLGKLLNEYGFEPGKEVLLPAPTQPEKKK